MKMTSKMKTTSKMKMTSKMKTTLKMKTTFGGRRPSVEDDLRWRTTFGGRRLLVEDDPCMLPSPLCGIFSYGLSSKCVVWQTTNKSHNLIYLAFDAKNFYLTQGTFSFVLYNSNSDVALGYLTMANHECRDGRIIDHVPGHRSWK